MVRKYDMFPQLSLKTHKGMKFLRSLTAAIVLCGSASVMATPVSAQIFEAISQPAIGGAQKAGSYAYGKRHLLGANRNPVMNFAQKQHLELQRIRAAKISAPKIRIRRASFGF